MPFFPLLTFKKFKEAIETFPDQKNLSEAYQSYPCLSKEDYFRIKNKIIKKYNNKYQNKPIFKDINYEKDYIPIRPSHCTHNINKLFVIWCFIKIIKGQLIIMDNDFYEIYNSDNNKIIIPIINEMSHHLKIDSHVLYYIINNFLNDLNKKIKKDSLTKSGISYKKYDKYWCRICKKFCCSFHFKVKIKPKSLDNNKIRTYIEYFKKIGNIMKPPEYLFKEIKKVGKNKSNLKSIIKEIIEKCPCKKQLNNEIIKEGKNRTNQLSEKEKIQNENEDKINKNEGVERENEENQNENEVKRNNNFVFDPSLRYNKMADIINKEDFFVLCKLLKTCYKLLCQKLEGLYKNKEIFNLFLTPCIIRKLLHNKYDCDLLQYLIKLIISEKYLDDINFFLTSDLGDNIKYESLEEEKYLFFNNTEEINQTPKLNKKGEKEKQNKVQRKKGPARLQIQSEKNLYYKPCDHYPLECTKINCPCANDGFCLKYCCCYKESKHIDSCKFLFKGCKFSQEKSVCTECFCKKNNIECIKGFCYCGEKCKNRNITLGKRKKLLFGYSEKIKGGGLFAGEKILKGEFIDSYDGEIVEKDELDRLSVFYDQTGNNYPFSINKKFDFVTIKCGGLTRYINHGSFGEQNVEADKMMVNGIPYIGFYALKDINEGEELYYDYSYDLSSMPDWNREYNLMMEKKIEKKSEKERNKQEKIEEYYITKFPQKKKGKKKDEKKKNEKSTSSDIIKLDEEEGF